MKSHCFVFVLLSFALIKQSAAGGADSVLRILAADYPKDEIFYWLDVDVNGDGTNDLLVTNASRKEENDNRDYEWLVYAGNADGTYTRLNGTHALRPDEAPITERTVTLRLNRYWIGFISEIGRRGLLHLVCGNGGHAQCQLMAVIIESNQFREVPVGQSLNAESSFNNLLLRFQGVGLPTTNSAKGSEIH